jgi:putative ABC transport system substrate-binding protein
MRRRDFFTVLGGAAALPLSRRVAYAQSERVRRVAVLMAAPEDDPDGQARLAAFLQGLQQLGWTHDRNMRIDTRWGGGDVERIRRDAAELVALAPDVILAGGGQVMAPLLEATRTIPIVFTQTPDPVGAGFVASLARPGGNVTGFTNFEYGVSAKWLELLKQIAPNVTRAAVLRDPTNPAGTGQWGAIQAVAPSFGVELSPIDVREAGEVERAVTAFAHAELASGASGQRGNSIVRAPSASEDARKRADDTRPEPGSSARGSNGGLIVSSSGFALRHRQLIATLAARHRLPAVYPFRVYATAGGLISYGPDPIDPHRRAASYVDRILKGEKPADLPVQSPTKYELVINLKSAKALGLEVPPSLIARADEVIE